MKVYELIGLLESMPQDLHVSVNDERGGNFHDDVEDVFVVEEDKVFGDRACVVLVVNCEIHG